MPAHSVLPMHITILILPTQRLHLLVLAAHYRPQRWLRYATHHVADCACDCAEGSAYGFEDGLETFA